MKLIGLIGRARSGKDTVGNYLNEHYDLRPLAFATPMKLMLKAAFPGVDFYAGDREAKLPWLGKSPRQLMQTLGTEWGRDCVHPELWTLLLERELTNTAAGGWPGAVVTDVRFHNEADMLLRHGAELWHIVRPDFFPVGGHVSEMADWESYPRRMILNDGSLDDLYRRLDLIMDT